MKFWRFGKKPAAKPTLENAQLWAQTMMKLTPDAEASFSNQNWHPVNDDGGDPTPMLIYQDYFGLFQTYTTQWAQENFTWQNESIFYNRVLKPSTLKINLLDTNNRELNVLMKEGKPEQLPDLKIGHANLFKGF